MLHAKALNVDRISCLQLMSRAPEIAHHLGYAPGGIQKGSRASMGMSREARAFGGGVPSMELGGVTASLQSIGASGTIKPEAKRAIAAALRKVGILADGDHVAAMQDRRQLVVVEVPRYFESREDELPLLVDYKVGGFNHQRAEEMLQESRLWDTRDDCHCECSLDADRTLQISRMQRIENMKVFEKFKLYEASVADDLRRRRQNHASPVYGMHPWLERLASKNGLSSVSNTVYLLHGTAARNLAEIRKEGLHSKFSLHGSQSYGQGLYFTVNSCKAFQYAGDGGCILVCRVVLGKVEVLPSECGARFFARPPAHSAKAQAGYTRRQNAVQVHDEYIVFSGDAVYPEFVLHVA